MRIKAEKTEHRWPVPTSEPEYERSSSGPAPRRRYALYDIVAAIFSFIGLIFAIWFGLLLLPLGIPGEPLWALNLIFFWALFAYLAIPRLHQVVSTIYVPDYFIGRTRTADGILGDPVNLSFDGEENDIHAVMRAAGWVKADPLSLRSSWKIILSYIFRRSYPAAPVSHLFLFDREEDFAYQKEVDGNISQRHHVRFWRTPPGWTLPGGIAVDWVAAATYDRSVGLSVFTGQVTHKIDPDVDAERDYLIATLRYADAEVGVGVVEQYFNAYHSRNGGGDEIHTDGDLPVLDINGAAERAGRAAGINEAAAGDDGGAGSDDPWDGAGATTQSREGGTKRRRSRGGVPVPAAVSEATRRELPPPPVGLAAVLIFLDVVLDLAWSLPQVPQASLAAFAVSAILLILVAARRRWAWVAFMLLHCAISFLYLSQAGQLEIGEIVRASFPVLAVFAVSASSARHWVGKRGGEPYVTVPPPVV